MGRVPEFVREIRKLSKLPVPLRAWEHSLSEYGTQWQSWDSKSKRVFKSVLLDTAQFTCVRVGLKMEQSFPF